MTDLFFLLLLNVIGFPVPLVALYQVKEPVRLVQTRKRTVLLTIFIHYQQCLFTMWSGFKGHCGRRVSYLVQLVKIMSSVVDFQIPEGEETLSCDPTRTNLTENEINCELEGKGLVR